jgi:hypothetical protein
VALLLQKLHYPDYLLPILSNNSLIKWKSEVGDINLENIFENISMTTNDIILRNFQYKLQHKILTTNMF